MGRRTAVGVAVLAAAVGAASALLVGWLTDLGERTTTVVESAPPTTSVTTTLPARRTGAGFDPEAVVGAESSEESEASAEDSEA